MLHSCRLGVLIQMCKIKKHIEKTIALKFYNRKWCIRYLNFVIWIKCFDFSYYAFIKLVVELLYILHIYVQYFEKWFYSNYTCFIDYR